MTRQRLWQRRQRALGRCPHCGGPPVAGAAVCLARLVYDRRDKPAAGRDSAVATRGARTSAAGLGVTPHFAASLARGVARSRKRRIGQHGLSREAREGRLDVWLCQCGHRSDELRPGHAAGACRAALNEMLDRWRLEIQPGKKG